MAESTHICPFCGGGTIKKIHVFDRVRELGGKIGVPHGSAEGTMKMDTAPQKEAYFVCNGCTKEYVWASMDINTLIEHFAADEIEAHTIASLIGHYYGNHVTLKDLLTKYRTGIVRLHNNKVPYISNKIAKRQLYLCFNYNGIRTFATFIKKRRNNYYYYSMKAMGIP